MQKFAKPAAYKSLNSSSTVIPNDDDEEINSLNDLIELLKKYFF